MMLRVVCKYHPFNTVSPSIKKGRYVCYYCKHELTENQVIHNVNITE